MSDKCFQLLSHLLRPSPYFVFLPPSGAHKLYKLQDSHMNPYSDDYSKKLFSSNTDIKSGPDSLESFYLQFITLENLKTSILPQFTLARFLFWCRTTILTQTSLPDIMDPSRLLVKLSVSWVAHSLPLLFISQAEGLVLLLVLRRSTGRLKALETSIISNTFITCSHYIDNLIP